MLSLNSAIGAYIIAILHNSYMRTSDDPVSAGIFATFDYLASNFSALVSMETNLEDAIKAGALVDPQGVPIPIIVGSLQIGPNTTTAAPLGTYTSNPSRNLSKDFS